MGNFVVAAVLALMLAANSFAAPGVLRATAIPEHGILAILGGGLVGLATLVRHHLSK